MLNKSFFSAFVLKRHPADFAHEDPLMRQNYTQLAKIINIISLWLRQHFLKEKPELLGVWGLIDMGVYHAGRA